MAPSNEPKYKTMDLTPSHKDETSLNLNFSLPTPQRRFATTGTNAEDEGNDDGKDDQVEHHFAELAGDDTDITSKKVEDKKQDSIEVSEEIKGMSESEIFRAKTLAAIGGRQTITKADIDFTLSLEAKRSLSLGKAIELPPSPTAKSSASLPFSDFNASAASQDEFKCTACGLRLPLNGTNEHRLLCHGASFLYDDHNDTPSELDFKPRTSEPSIDARHQEEISKPDWSHFTMSCTRALDRFKKDSLKNARDIIDYELFLRQFDQEMAKIRAGWDEMKRGKPDWDALRSMTRDIVELEKKVYGYDTVGTATAADVGGAINGSEMKTEAEGVIAVNSEILGSHRVNNVQTDRDNVPDTCNEYTIMDRILQAEGIEERIARMKVVEGSFLKDDDEDSHTDQDEAKGKRDKDQKIYGEAGESAEFNVYETAHGGLLATSVLAEDIIADQLADTHGGQAIRTEENVSTVNDEGPEEEDSAIHNKDQAIDQAMKGRKFRGS